MNEKPADRLPDQLLERGMAVRRVVLGEEYVDRVSGGRTPFEGDFQDLVTGFAWGAIWTRPGLERRIRSCITVAMLVALNRPQELALHIRAAIRNGVTAGELEEVLLQSAAYCGLPAANGAFHVAREVLAELPTTSPPGPEYPPEPG